MPPRITAMTLDRVLAWLPLVIIALMMIGVKLRAFAMQRRGLRVIVVDWRRPLKDVLYDALLIVVFLPWFYVLVAEPLELSLAWLPNWLTARLHESLLVRMVGAGLIILAPVLLVAAIRSMGASWRIGIDRQQPGQLVTSGLFGWSRNPIYLAFDLLVVGAFLIHGHALFLILGAAMMLLIHAVVLREERFLEAQFGDAFGNYRNRVGRYGSIWPRTLASNGARRLDP
jgi:protein-S-isoprenylcysteine O-methyltransferase Ste14